MPSPTTSKAKSKSKSKPKRKSWLPFSKKNNSEEDPTDPALDSSAQSPTQGDQVEELSLRPIQFAPNRLATLYVTKSERNLYLAAMSSLDQNPPNLPLWSDPAPSLPLIERSLPIHPPPLPARPNQTYPSVYDHRQPVHVPASGSGTEPQQHQSRGLPMSHHNNAKLMASPEAQTNGGLMIRDEFRRLPPAKEVRHASMTLTSGGGLNFYRFPANVLMDLEPHFPANKVPSESGDALRQKSTGVVPVYSVEMFGSLWKRAGNEELDPIRLLVAILNTVGTHGWSVSNSMRAGSAKNDIKTLLFSHSYETSIAPPVYFAISFPLPDRISLISPPPKAIPGLISTIRNAIISTSASASHSRSGTANTVDTQASGGSEGKAKVTWKDKKAKIKLEGWVHDGVYRFWLDGMRRKLVGGVKRDVVASLQPHVVLNIISGLSSQHYTFSTSIPLLPATAGRDILLFASQPDTGVVATDAFQPKPPARPTSSQSIRSESPVLVQRTSSFPAPLEDLNATNPREVDPERRVLPWTSTVMSTQPGQETPTTGHQHQDQHQRQVSDSIREPGSPTKTQVHLHPRSTSALRNHGPDQGRDPSIDSSRPLLQNSSASAQSSPRHRNVLVKKTSLRQRTSSAESKQHSLAPRSRRVSDVGAQTTGVLGDPINQRGKADTDSWTMIDAPPNVGRMGLTMYTDNGDNDHRQQAIGESDHQTIPAPQITSIGHGNGHPPPLPNIAGGDYTPNPNPSHGRQGSDQHSGSDESIYETPSAAPDFSQNPPPPPPNQEFTSSSLPLGQPMTSTTTGSALSSMPAHLQLRTPRSPNRVQGAQEVDIGVPSVYGSVGYLPSMVSQNPSMFMPDPNPMPNANTNANTNASTVPASTGQGHDRSTSEALEFLMSHRAETTQDAALPRDDWKGKGKEGGTRVWDEGRGAWVQGVEPRPVNGSGSGGGGGNGNGADGPGSARTRVSMMR